MRIGEATNLDDLLVALDAARQRRLNLRRGIETIWWENLALMGGDHYSRWNPNRAAFEDRDPQMEGLGDKQARLVINHALAVARTELSKMTKSLPIMEIIANSDEEVDLAAAKVGRAGLDYAEWKFKLRKMRKDAYWWMVATGLSAIYVGYDHMNDAAGFMEFIIDPNTGDPTFNPDRKKELQRMDDEGEIDLKTEKYPLGELEYKLYTPFQMFPDETALDFETINNLITDDVTDLDIVRGMYGKAAAKLSTEDVSLGTIEKRLMQQTGFSRWQAVEGVKDAVNLHTFWLLPGVYPHNSFLKDGLYVRWAQKKLLDSAKAFPFQDNRMPFAFFQHIPRHTSIWPDCVITAIRGLNLELDKTVSQLVANKDYMANPMWRIATQHKVKGKVKNVAGAILRYVHSPNIPPPEPIQGLQLPSQVENLVKVFQDQILQISGQSEVARGSVPTGVRSGVAVAYLQEEDDTKIAPTIDNNEMVIAYMGSLTLERYAQFYVNSRLLRFYRRDGTFDVIKFKGADLKNNTDVICQTGSAQPRSKAARQQYVLELVSLGIMTDPKQIQEALDIGQADPNLDDLQVSLANRENNVMLHGMSRGLFDVHGEMSDEEMQQIVATAVPVKKWHNHQVHLQRHYAQMAQEEMDRLQISHPEIVRLFDEHTAMHEQMIQQAQQAQAAMLMAAKGAPDGPPGQSPAPGGDGNLVPGVIAKTTQQDPIGKGSLGLQTRDRIAPGPTRQTRG